MDETRIWDKTSEEITVGDAVKIATVETVVVTAVMVGFVAVCAGIGHLVDRRRAKKELKQEELLKK